MLARKKQADIEFTAAAVLVRNARRFYSNSVGQWGRTYAQRIQTKLSNAMLPLYYMQSD